MVDPGSLPPRNYLSWQKYLADLRLFIIFRPNLDDFGHFWTNLGQFLTNFDQSSTLFWQKVLKHWLRLPERHEVLAGLLCGSPCLKGGAIILPFQKYFLTANKSELNMAEVLKMSGHRCTKPTFVELGGGGIRVQAKNGEIILSFTFIFGVFGRTNSQGAQIC